MIALAASYSLGPGDHLPEYLIRYLLLRAIDLFGWSQEARNRWLPPAYAAITMREVSPVGCE